MTHRSAWAGQVGETDRETIFGLKGPVEVLEEIATPWPAFGSSAGRVVTRFKPDGNRVDTIRYESSGGLKSRDVFGYDEQGRRSGPRFHVGREDKLHRYLRFTYDDTGKRRAVQRQFMSTDELDFTLRFSYDELGRRVKMEWAKPDGTVFRRYELRYDSLGNRVGMESRDGSGRVEWVSRASFDARGRMIVSRRSDGRLPSSIEWWHYSDDDSRGNWTRAVRWRVERVRRVVPVPSRTVFQRRISYYAPEVAETR